MAVVPASPAVSMWTVTRPNSLDVSCWRSSTCWIRLKGTAR